VVWTINAQDVLFIGRLFETGKTDFRKIVALTGSEVEKPKYYQTILGTPIQSLIDRKLKTAGYNQRNIRRQRTHREKSLITKATSVSTTHKYTVIPEGDEYERFRLGNSGN
jgi:Na+-transporting NADH:ubiquinone oxidoreductase subunit A